MNELDLIKEVEKRPILYDKSVSGFNKTKLRDEAWKDVQEALHVSESECKKRWRSLRDSFIKLRRTHGSRTRWPYHHAMRFLLPHVEPKSEVERENSRQDNEDSDPEEEIKRQRQIAALPALSTLPALQPLHSLPDLSFTEKFEEEDCASHNSHQSQHPQSQQPSPKKARLNSTEEEVSCQCNRTDPDELFLLSCAPSLKRLNAKQNAVARLKIQQALYEAEFGVPMELPYVTQASECGFENNAIEESSPRVLLCDQERWKRAIVLQLPTTTESG